MQELTIRDHMTLQLAAAQYRYPAVRETHAAEQLGYTPVRFWQRLNWLLDQPAALVAYPSDVRRLQRLRAARERQRRISA